MPKPNNEIQAKSRKRKDAAYKYVKLLAKRKGIPLPSRTRGAKFDKWLDEMIREMKNK